LGADRTPNDGELVVTTPIGGEDLDELIVELARYCAELLFHEQFSAEPANDNS
jgi:hypothetical protein